MPGAIAALAGAIDAEPDGLADVVAAMAAFIGLPSTLRDCGVDEEDLDAIARLSQSSPNVRANPRPVSEDEARAVLDEAY